MSNNNTVKSTLAADSAARVTNVVKNYPGVLALNEASIDIKPGEVRALLGKNGAGKSTLIRMLTGAEIPDQGDVYVGETLITGSSVQRTRKAAENGLRAVYQELSLVAYMDVAENMYMGHWPKKGGIIDSGSMHREAQKIIDELGFPIQTDSLISNLSPAHQQLVEIARAMMGEPKIVILDEPTSSLATEEVELVFEAVRRIASKGIAVLYVSHRMKEIKAIASTATVMRDGSIIGTVNISDTDISKIVQMMLGKSQGATRLMEKRQTGDKVLEVSCISQFPKLKEVSFHLNKMEVLGIAGLLGSGRTELLRIISGIDKADSGDINLEGNNINNLPYVKRIEAGIAITPENRKDEGIFPLLGVDENIVLCDWSKVASGGVINRSSVGKNASDTVKNMNIKVSEVSNPIQTLSGGNQQKVVIGRWIYAGSDILLLDEPTRGIDVEAKAQIYEIVRNLAAEGKSIIFVSSEIEELPLVCDRVIVLREGKIDSEFIAPDIDVETLMSASIK